jgi:hypothetical protein
VKATVAILYVASMVCELAGAGLVVVPREVVDGDAADWGFAVERGVGPVMVVGVEELWQGRGALG